MIFTVGYLSNLFPMDEHSKYLVIYKATNQINTFFIGKMATLLFALYLSLKLAPSYQLLSLVLPINSQKHLII